MKLKPRRKVKNGRSISTTSMIALGFFCAIVIGTLLLMLPVASVTGEWTSPLDALFTATTSVCVTGLVVVNTFSYWSIFGQIVILILIQFGGLGIVSFTTLIMLAIGRKVTLKDRLLLEDALNLNTLSGLVRFLKKVFKGTLLVEAIGAFFYMIVFVPEFGAKGVWISVFTAVSAFCNAGIDIIGEASLMPYVSNELVNIVTMILIVMGGIGFIVWWDIGNTLKRAFKKEIRFGQIFAKLKLHSKIVLNMTLVLILFGAFLVFILEYNNPLTLGDMSLPDKIMTSFFQSVTTRTAGFATISQKGMYENTAFVCMILMFIGGSSVGTAGGIKTGTIAVIIVAAKSMIKGNKDAVVYGRTIPLVNIRKSLAVILISLFAVFLATIGLTIVMDVNFMDGAFEVVSAIATAGLSRDTTALLNIPGKLIIIVCMYLGRIGPISMAILFARRAKKESKIAYPEEEITVG